MQGGTSGAVTYTRFMEPVGSSVTTVQPEVDERLDSGDPFEHIVCCRGSWDVALCGADTTYSPVVFFVQEICPKCGEEAQRRYQALGISDFPDDVVICFETGRPCPQGDEAEQLWLRVLSTPEKLGPS